jgi:chromosome partitioning protein
MSELNLIAVSAGRGGTGKSTLTYGIAHTLLAEKGMTDVAMLDLDPQAGLTTRAGKTPVAEPTKADAVEVFGITLYRGGRGLSQATDKELARHIARAVSEGSSDRVVIADMPPALHDRVHRLVFERDDSYVLGAIRCEPDSFHSMNELVAQAVRAGRPYMLVPTFYAKKNAQNATLLALQSQHEGHVTETLIPQDNKAVDCVLSKQPVSRYAPRSKVALAISALLDEVLATETDAEAASTAGAARRRA